MDQLSTSEARSILLDIAERMSRDGEPVLATNRGNLILVLVAPSDFEKLVSFRKGRCAQDLRDRFDQAMTEQAERNKDLTEEQAEEIVQMFIRDVREYRCRIAQEAAWRREPDGVWAMWLSVFELERERSGRPEYVPPAPRKEREMKRMSATEAKNHWGDLVKMVTEDGEPVIIENRREPVLIAISPADFAELETLRRDRRLQKAREALREIERLQAGRNDELTDDEVEALGIEAAREVRDNLDRRLYGHSLPSR